MAAEKWVLILGLVSLSMVVNAAVPAVFIFGDSTADVGTNTFLNDTIAKANYLYNGIDFPGSVPTGRFSNGFNTADYISKLMGFKRSPPPYLALTSTKQRLYKHVQNGVNFASGASGILDDTGSGFGNIVCLTEQIQQFTTVSDILTAKWGRDQTASFLSKSVFIISVGGNDILEVFASNRTSSNKGDFIVNLRATYENHFRKLYSLGARKFGVISVAPVGCCPSQLDVNTGACSDELNEYSQMFFSSAEALLQNLVSEFNEMKYSLGNAYAMVMGIINYPTLSNFTELKTACCGNGAFNAQEICRSPSAKVCGNRDEYLFWDKFHPTQAASQLAAQTLYSGPQIFVAPINFKQLAELD